MAWNLTGFHAIILKSLFLLFLHHRLLLCKFGCFGCRRRLSCCFLCLFSFQHVDLVLKWLEVVFFCLEETSLAVGCLNLFLDLLCDWLLLFWIALKQFLTLAFEHFVEICLLVAVFQVGHVSLPLCVFHQCLSTVDGVEVGILLWEPGLRITYFILYLCVNLCLNYQNSAEIIWEKH